MDWRRSELAAFGPDVVPLDCPDSAGVYDLAMSLCNRKRYGLDETTLADIERLEVNGPGLAVQAWLASRVSGELLMVFGRDDVYRVSAKVFIANWQDMFCPSQDDVVIVPVNGGWALFYCHEDEFEFARL